MRAAFSNCGSIARRSRSEARRAGLIGRFAISTANRSSASSTACASSWRTIAVNSAVRRGSGARSIVCALLNCPSRASVDSRFTGTRDRFTRPSANAEISSTRSIARTIAVPVDFTGGVRSRSSSGRVGTWVNVPYASACSSGRNSTGTRRTVASANSRPATFPRTPAAAASRVLADHDQSQRHFLYRNYSHPGPWSSRSSSSGSTRRYPPAWTCT